MACDKLRLGWLVISLESVSQAILNEHVPQFILGDYFCHVTNRRFHFTTEMTSSNRRNPFKCMLFISMIKYLSHLCGSGCLVNSYPIEGVLVYCVCCVIAVTFCELTFCSGPVFCPRSNRLGL